MAQAIPNEITLQDAVSDGDLASVEALASSGVGVNVRDSEGKTPLHTAASKGYFDIIITLLSASAEVNAKDRDCQTPLHIAASKLDLDVVNTLIRSGAEVNAQDEDGNTPIHIAASKLDLNVVNTLIRSGAEVNAQDKDGNTPIHIAASKLDLDVVNTLISSGAEVNAQDKDGNTPIHIAAGTNNCNIDIIEMLMQGGADIKSKNTKEEIPPYCAMTAGNIALVKFFIEAGVDVNTSDKFGNTGGHNAAFNGRLEIMQLLLKNGYQVNSRNWKGYIPLHFAARENHLDVVNLLINNKSNLDTLCRTGDSPVMLAARLGHDDIVSCLMKRGANLFNEEDGRTVLHKAAQGNRLHTIQFLMKKDVYLFQSLMKKRWIKPTPIDEGHTSRDSTAKDNTAKYYSAEDYANIAGSSSIAWLLNKQLKKPQNFHPFEQCLFEYEKSGTNIIKRAGMHNLRESGWLEKSINDGDIEMHYMDKLGNTILHVAADSNNIPTLENLLKMGALTVARNYQNQTPLDIAEMKGYQEIANLLSSKLIIDSISSGKSCELYTKLLYEITEAVGLETYSEKDNDVNVQKKRLEVVRKVGELLSKGVPHEPMGSCERQLLPLAISTSNRTLLPLLLAAGLPLTTMDSGLGMVQLAKHAEDNTTWVIMVVTRAFVHRLLMEKNIKEIDHADDPLVTSLNKKLDQCIDSLVQDLRGEKPWDAKVKHSNALKELFAAACKRGATITCWYIWKAGVNLYQRTGPENCTALEIALVHKKYDTAMRLVLDMNSNPFIKDKGNKVLIDRFPEAKAKLLMEIMLGQDYRRLERNYEKAKEDDEKQEFKQMILLLMILFLQYCEGGSMLKWKSYLIFVLAALSEIENTSQKTTAAEILWMENLSNALKRRLDPAVTQDISDEMYNLFYAIKCHFDPHIPENDEDNESDINVLLSKSLLVCCEQQLSLFLHLLVCVAEVNVNSIVNDVCQTSPLHHSAKHNIMSAVAYLLQCGASSTFQDRFGILPADYAYMFGHKGSGDFIRNPYSEDSDSRECETDELKEGGSSKSLETKNNNSEFTFAKAFQEYLKQYDLSSIRNSKSRHQDVRRYDKLLEDRLEHLKKKWECDGLKESIAKITVNYEDKEASEVKSAVTKVLTLLKDEIVQRNPLYDGDLEFVGSSIDNVRMYCPDEYDCNLVLKKVNGFANDGPSINLVNLDDQQSFNEGHKQRLEVSFQEDLKNLLEDSKFLKEFYSITRESLKELDVQNCKLKLLLPGIKRTQVGVNLTFLWLGEKYPMLFVDVDFVPTLRAPWPEDLPKPNCGSICNELNEVFLNSIGKNEWRFSFGQAETRLMINITDDQRTVYLACKMILANLKTEKWVPQNIRCNFEYWLSRFFALPAKGGFALKNSFFRELEEITVSQEWEYVNVLKRMRSIFRRMCKFVEVNDKDKPTSEGASTVKESEDASNVKETEVSSNVKETEDATTVQAYFGGETEKASIYECAPAILDFLRKLDESVIMKVPQQ